MPGALLELEREPFLRCPADVHCDLHAECVGGELLVRGRLTVVLECLCSRCGKWFSRRLEVSDFTRVFPMPAGNESIDLTTDIREDIILSFPSNWLCGESCRGLCPVCGADLNDGDCACREQTPPGWAGAWDVLNLELDRKKNGPARSGNMEDK
ncbi:MAG: DUF177 domain-containing protein [Kiritimatiellia bacterium]|nr:DUF177 domain-containing protein [Lentisphaerota bacterium]